MKLLRILLLAISLTTTLFARAYDFEANGLYYDIISAGDLTCALVDGPSPYTGALVIPDEVEYSDKKLKVISVKCKLPEVSSVNFGQNINEVIEYCFKDNGLISNITIPQFLRTIGKYAFENCTSLISVKWVGDMILSEGIFSGCFKLKTLLFSSICKDIPPYSFNNCSSLSIDLSEVKHIGSSAFTGCKSLNIIDLSSIKGDIQGKNIFSDCGKLSLVIIGPNVDQIWYENWKNCIIDSLRISPTEEPLFIGATLALAHLFHGPRLGYEVFEDTSIKSLYLGRSVYSEMDDYQPFFEKNINFVHVGSLVTSFPSFYVRPGKWYGYFQGCKSLTKIIFESEDVYLGNNCFKDTGIEEIYFLHLNYDLKRGQQPGFSKEQYNCAKLYVPHGYKEEFQITSPWSNFKNIEELSGVNAERVEIKPIKVDLHVGDSIQLIGICYPENSVDTIQWKSSNDNIATISYNGLVKANALGKVTITALCGNVSATCEVTVLPITAEKIVLDLTEVFLNQSDTIKITASITPENTTDKTITWSSSDEKVATVSTDGIITAVGVGKATITASCGDIAATCEVTVLEPNIVTDFAENKLTVTVEGSGKPVEISIYSVMGQCVFQKTIEAAVTVKDEIDLSSLSAGTYIVQIISGEMNTSKRIVK